MKTTDTALVLALLVLGVFPAHAQDGDVFDRVASTLQARYYDEDFRRQQLPGLIEAFRPLARRAETLEDERLVIHTFLSRIPASHLSLYSQHTLDELLAELSGEDRVRFGVTLVELEGLYFAVTILEGGPAAEAGLLRGDRVLAIDGVPVGRSQRLDWRTDDAFLPDPPTHRVMVAGEPRVRLSVERSPDDRREIEIEAGPYSAWKAARASVRVETIEEQRVGYVHFWYIFHAGMAEMLQGLFEGELADCSALVVDLRGRGGNAVTAQKLIRTLKRGWDRPIIALIDHGTRSAKEVIAFELKRQDIAILLGEKTPGAVIPATFQRVGGGAVLMYPSFTLGQYTDHIEHIGVSPDILVEDVLPYAAGADPIRDAGFLAASLEASGLSAIERMEVGTAR